MSISFGQRIANSLSLQAAHVQAAIRLLEDGATIPFIARYRKEACGGLDEVQISDIQDALRRLQELEKRRESILRSIEEQGKLTPELRRAVESADSMTALEDLYLPYKPKRKTRAGAALEKGLGPLADLLIAQRPADNPEALARAFVNEATPTVAEALQGARDIIAERVNEDAHARSLTRRHFEKGAVIMSRVARGKEEEGVKYVDYFNWSEKLATCPSHRLLAMRRGEAEGMLRVSIAPAHAEELVAELQALFVKGRSASGREVAEAVADAYKRLIEPAIETEYRNSSKEKADEEAIRVFADNLAQLLLAAPLGEQVVMGIDPGFRTGCKVVCLSPQGKLLHHTAIYPHPPQGQTIAAAQTLARLAASYSVRAIAVGNGTAGRETLDFLRGVAWEGESPALYAVNEAGASIYSASEMARAEFPDLDLTVRGAVSIGRRLMDPLSELTKIDPKNIGVGQYQHDVDQARLRESLDRTVTRCVNAVGVNLNTAGASLLTYVSGLGPSLAQNIVKYREENGPFGSRQELKKVSRLGDKAFEQCAGFLRIRHASNPLDNTAVHPERYALVGRMAADLGCSVQQLIADAALRRQIDLSRYVGGDVGLPTLRDILRELEKPGLDPRGEAIPVEFSEARQIEDLHPGMVLNGVVNNITNFGAFVDLGLKVSGLVHVSQLADKFVRNPMEVVQLNQQVRVKVLEVDVPRKRISLTMRGL
ncbi:MAG: Tex family protein [Saprospiraceae bacterium]